ncbi:D-alanyl-D-alanine carboxypeptidase family protein [Peptococcus simiae]|uniref:D-alanyl-D-alanine carboxypeptidase family protein n=1 Tax=Peptococcus simiae TaxID=1643805 RepID=UPI00397EC992
MKKKLVALWLLLSLVAGLLPPAAHADVLKEGLPEVAGASYVVMDGDSHEVLFGKKYDQTFDPQTLVQMMTAVLIIEKGNLKDTVTAPEMPAAINSGNTVFLRKNEEFKLSRLLEAILVYNANDAAYAAAVHIGGSEEKFLAMMNARAKELGMNNTEFKSVYGGAKGQKSTAHDMALLAAKASSLKKYVEYTLKPTMNWNGEMFAHDNIPNANGFQQIMEDGIGLKLSNEKGSKEDKLHLAASYTHGGRTVIAVVAGAESEAGLYVDIENLLTFGMENTKSMKLISKDTPLATLTLAGDQKLRVAAQKDVSVTTVSSNSLRPDVATVLNKIDLPIKKGDIVGEAKVGEGSKATGVPLVALDDVKKPFDWWKCLAIVLLLALLALVIIRLYALSRRRPNPPRQPKGPHQGKKRRPPTRALKSAQAPQASLPHNPSQGSDRGRRGLEDRVRKEQNRRTTYTIHREYPGDDR